MGRVSLHILYEGDHSSAGQTERLVEQRLCLWVIDHFSPASALLPEWNGLLLQKQDNDTPLTFASPKSLTNHPLGVYSLVSWLTRRET
jgi:hypothetical protein